MEMLVICFDLVLATEKEPEGFYCSLKWNTVYLRFLSTRLGVTQAIVEKVSNVDRRDLC